MMSKIIKVLLTLLLLSVSTITSAQLTASSSNTIVSNTSATSTIIFPATITNLVNASSVTISPSDGTTVEASITATNTLRIIYTGLSASTTYTATIPASIAFSTVGSTPTDAGTIIFTTNRAPVGVDDAITVSEDSGTSTISVLDNDTDAESATTSLTITNLTIGNNNITAVVSGTVIAFSPATNFNGEVTLTYTPNDGLIDGSVATVTITVDNLNDPTNITLSASTAIQGTTLTVMIDDIDGLEGVTVTYWVTRVSDGASASFATDMVTTANATTSSADYIPTNDDVGSTLIFNAAYTDQGSTTYTFAASSRTVTSGIVANLNDPTNITLSASTAIQGTTLTVMIDDIDGLEGVTVTYWVTRVSDGASASFATDMVTTANATTSSADYIPTNDDVGSTLIFNAAYTDQGSTTYTFAASSRTVTSGIVANLNDPTNITLNSSTAIQGTTLTVMIDDIDGLEGVTVTYWVTRVSDGASASFATDMVTTANATTSSADYIPTNDDVGSTLIFNAAYTDQGSTTYTFAASSRTVTSGIVANLNDPTNITLSASTAIQGTTLTVMIDDIDGLEGVTVTYWVTRVSDGASASFATDMVTTANATTSSADYIPTNDDVGSTLIFNAAYTDQGSTTYTFAASSRTVTSGIVANLNDPTNITLNSSTAIQGTTLTVMIDDIDGLEGVTVTYWVTRVSDGASASFATDMVTTANATTSSADYIPTNDDVGSTLIFNAAYTDQGSTTYTFAASSRTVTSGIVANLNDPTNITLNSSTAIQGTTLTVMIDDIDGLEGVTVTYWVTRVSDGASASFATDMVTTANATTSSADYIPTNDDVGSTLIFNAAYTDQGSTTYTFAASSRTVTSGIVANLNDPTNITLNSSTAIQGTTLTVMIDDIDGLEGVTVTYWVTRVSDGASASFATDMVTTANATTSSADYIPTNDDVGSTLIFNAAYTDQGSTTYTFAASSRTVTSGIVANLNDPTNITLNSSTAIQGTTLTVMIDDIDGLEGVTVTYWVTRVSDGASASFATDMVTTANATTSSADYIPTNDDVGSTLIFNAAYTDQGSTTYTFAASSRTVTSGIVANLNDPTNITLNSSTAIQGTTLTVMIDDIDGLEGVTVTYWVTRVSDGASASFATDMVTTANATTSSADYIPTNDDVGSTLIFNAAYTDQGSTTYTFAASSRTVTSGIVANLNDPTNITLNSSTAIQGTTLTVMIDDIDGLEGVTVTYWVTRVSDGASASFATDMVTTANATTSSADYIPTNDDVGSTLIFNAAYTDQRSTTYTFAASSRTVTSGIVANLNDPTNITLNSSTAIQGTTLTVMIDDIDGLEGVTVTYWVTRVSDGASASFATDMVTTANATTSSADYIPTNDDVGSTLIFNAAYTDQRSTTYTFAASSRTVTSGIVANLNDPTNITLNSSTAIQGTTLTVMIDDIDGLEGVTVTYWVTRVSDGASASFATDMVTTANATTSSADYIPTNDDVGSTLIFNAAYTDQGSTTYTFAASSRTVTSGIVANLNDPTNITLNSSTAIQGTTLTVMIDDIDGLEGVTVTYWVTRVSDGASASFATDMVTTANATTSSADYIPTNDDVGSTLIFNAAYTDQGSTTYTFAASSRTVTSGIVANLNDPTNITLNSSTAIQGTTLTVMIDDIDGLEGVTVTYWVTRVSDGASASFATDMVTTANATTSSADYIPTNDDVGSTLIFNAAYTDQGSTTYTFAASSRTVTSGIVANLNDPTNITLNSSTAIQGTTLTVMIDDIDGLEGVTVTYWVTRVSDGASASFATDMVTTANATTSSADYIPTNDDVGSTLIFNAAYTDQGSTTYTFAASSRTVTSGIVANLNDPTNITLNSSTAIQGTTLTVMIDDIDGLEGVTVTYWVTRVSDGASASFATDMVTTANATTSSADYIPTNDDVGSTLIFNAAYTDQGSTTYTFAASSRTVTSGTVASGFSLDIDGDGQRLQSTDGILIIRFIGDQSAITTTGATATGATRDNAEILSYLTSGSSLLDIDGDGQSLQSTDGILIIRFIGDQSAITTTGAIGTGATRNNQQILDYLNSIF